MKLWQKSSNILWNVTSISLAHFEICTLYSSHLTMLFDATMLFIESSVWEQNHISEWFIIIIYFLINYLKPCMLSAKTPIMKNVCGVKCVCFFFKIIIILSEDVVVSQSNHGTSCCHLMVSVWYWAAHAYRGQQRGTPITWGTNLFHPFQWSMAVVMMGFPFTLP